MERVYEIAKNFRNEGMSRFHNPEFTMVEFYAAYFDYEDVMRLAEELLAHVVEQACGGSTLQFGAHRIEVSAPIPRLPMYQALREIGGVDVEALSDDALRARVRELGVDAVDMLGRGALIDELFGALVEPKLIQPTFITDYPGRCRRWRNPNAGIPS